MTSERLLRSHDSEPQNPVIANVFNKSKVLESWGRGIGLMVSECRRVRLPDPEVAFGRGFCAGGVSLCMGYCWTNPHSYPTSKKVLVVIDDSTYSAKEIMESMGLKDKRNFLENYIYPAIKMELVELLYPQQPKHPKQKYYLTEKGKTLIKRG